VLRVRVDVDAPVVALELRELEVTRPRQDFDGEVAAAEAAARDDQVARTDRARDLYRRFGTDPTKHRPSSEALLRRVRRGEPLPRINSLVDVANVLSLRLQVPVGLYDLEKAKGDELVVRRGEDFEWYEGIRKEWVGLGGRLCVADAEGPCGNPSSDSARTQITTATERAAWIYFLPVSEEWLDRTAELIARYGRGLVSLV
jgi:DNA/RNA-binding domain of Phe-tRNA-synthetase-like protein